MKIAVWHNLPSGGGKRALYHHVKGLVERGHQVEAWCPPTADQRYLPLGEVVKEHVVPLDEISQSRSYVNRLRLTVSPIHRSLRAMNKHCRACAQQIAQGGFDLLFANSCPFFAATAIGRLTPLPGVLYLQEPCRHLYEALPNSPWAAREDFDWRRQVPRQASDRIKDFFGVPARRLQIREEIKNAKAYRQVLVNSSFSRENVLRAYGIESRVCYLGVDTEKFAWNDTPRKAQVVGVGFLQYQKGVDRVVRALAAIPLELRPAFLWIGNCINADYRLFVEDLARDMSVSFRFMENVSDTELVKVLQESYATVYLTRLEPFGYGPLEANCCGLPVIGIAEGGIRETVRDGINGFLVQNASSKELAAALMKLLVDPALTAAMRRQGRQLAEQQWSIEGATSRLEQELQAIINHP